MTRTAVVRAGAIAGTMITALAVTAAPAHAARWPTAPCPAKYICLYSEPNFEGRMLPFTVCRFEDIGRQWGNDRIRSIQNFQTPGTRTDFYNWYASTSSWQQVGYSIAKGEYPTVSARVQTAEGLRVC